MIPEVNILPRDPFTKSLSPKCLPAANLLDTTLQLLPLEEGNKHDLVDFVTLQRSN